MRPVEGTNQHQIKLLSLLWANYGGTELDLLCKCLWACENQMTLFRQKFPVLGMEAVGRSAHGHRICGGQQRWAQNDRPTSLLAAAMQSITTLHGNDTRCYFYSLEFD